MKKIISTITLTLFLIIGFIPVLGTLEVEAETSDDLPTMEDIEETGMKGECYWDIESESGTVAGRTRIDTSEPACNESDFVKTNEKFCEYAVKDKKESELDTNESYACCCPKSKFQENTESLIQGLPKWQNPSDNLQVDIPGMDRFSTPTCYLNEQGEKICENPWIGEYIKGLYNYAIGIVGMLAVVVIAIGGVVWLTSGGNQNRISQAKTWISGAVIGLILALASFVILKMVNEDLTAFKPLKTEVLTMERECPPDSKYDGTQECCKSCQNCVSTGSLDIEVKDGEALNKGVAEKLRKTYEDMGDKQWRITESWPPEICHKSECHTNGNCVDVALTNTGEKGSDKYCDRAKNLKQKLEEHGFTNVVNEYVSCESGSEGSKYSYGDHLHVE